MAEPRDDKTVVIPEVPTQITATQVIAVILSLAACRYASGVLAPLTVALLIAVALAPIVRAFGGVMPRWLASALGGDWYCLGVWSDGVGPFRRSLGIQ
jgi:hypothetical protein